MGINETKFDSGKEGDLVQQGGRTEGETRAVRLLPVSLIAASPNQPRVTFSEETLTALADSIARHGLMAPIIVRERAAGYELVAGERRLRAVKMLGRDHIDALIVRADDAEAAAMTLIENLQRKDLHFFEEAEAYRRLLDRYGFSQQSLAACVGVSQPTISNKLRLLTLSDPVRLVIETGGLSERHARAVLGVEDERERLRLVTRAADEKMSVRALEELCKRARTRDVRAGAYRLYPRDQRLLINAVLRAVSSLKQAGVKATSRVERKESCLEVTVSIPVSASRSGAPCADTWVQSR